MRKWWKNGGAAALFLLLSILSLGIAQADLKATNVVYAWDIVQQKYQNSNVSIQFNGMWESFWHELDFDNDPWPDACGPGTSTKWAGNMYYGLYHTDNNPAGAPGFQETRHWELVDCDRNGDGKFNIQDLSVSPPTYRVTWATCTTNPGYCRLISQDVPTPCSTGNCLDEIVTTFFINLDLDCNGTIDQPLPPAGLCFYAESRVPPPPAPNPMWAGPLQARISTVGGDKTVNFQLEPTAVKLLSFTAQAQAGRIVLSWETAGEVDNLGFNLYRREVGLDAYTRLNPTLIPSHSPGQGQGATYEFIDEDVTEGVRYEYLLEDVDIYGTRTPHGPVTARALYAVFLPAVRK